MFVAVMGCLFNVGGVEVLLHKDLDTNEELRDAGWVNVATGLFGAIPGYHALSLTALAQQMAVDGRRAGLVAALVPIAALVFGADIVGLVPRIIVGGVLVFVGLSFLVSWIVDMRRSLPVGEYLIVLVILLSIATRGLMTGLVVGLVLAVVLFAVNYGRIDLVRDVAFGVTYRSNVDRPPGERAVLQEQAERVQILRLNGFVFFGTASGFLERIRKRVEAGPLVFAGAPDGVERQLRRGGLVPSEVIRFEPDLDHALQRCEDVLLEEAGPDRVGAVGEGGRLPPHLMPYLERRSLPEGSMLIRQGDPPDAMFVLESGRLRVELSTPEGARRRLSTVRPGVMVGEIALYTGVPRTADVIAETPCVVLGLSRASIERLEAEEPETAAALHRWLASTLAVRLTDADRAYSASLD